MPALRHIAVHVEEPRRGQFVWVLTERDGDAWQPLEQAGSAERSYRRAMAQGLLALQRLVGDLDVGPRAPAEAPPPSKGAPAAAPAQGGRYFGFGPAR